ERSALQSLEVDVSEELQKNRWWLEAGPDLPAGLELIGGPSACQGNACYASFLVSGSFRVGPGDRLVAAKPMTETDDKLFSYASQ
ncbi:unnamed protein product, partial [Prorocentrum cordatum]